MFLSITILWFCITSMLEIQYCQKLYLLVFGCFWCLQDHGTIFGGIWEEFQRQQVANRFYWCVDRYLAIPMIVMIPFQ